MQITYEKNVTLLCSKSFDGIYSLFQMLPRQNPNFNMSLNPAQYTGIKPTKVKDVKDLLVFMSLEDRAWIETIMEEISVNSV